MGSIYLINEITKPLTTFMMFYLYFNIFICQWIAHWKKGISKRVSMIIINDFYSTNNRCFISYRKNLQNEELHSDFPFWNTCNVCFLLDRLNFVIKMATTVFGVVMKGHNYPASFFWYDKKKLNLQVRCLYDNIFLENMEFMLKQN